MSATEHRRISPAEIRSRIPGLTTETIAALESAALAKQLRGCRNPAAETPETLPSAHPSCDRRPAAESPQVGNGGLGEILYLLLRLCQVMARFYKGRFQLRILRLKNRHLLFVRRGSLLKQRDALPQHRGKRYLLQQIGEYAHDVLLIPRKRSTRQPEKP